MRQPLFIAVVASIVIGLLGTMVRDARGEEQQAKAEQSQRILLEALALQALESQDLTRSKAGLCSLLAHKQFILVGYLKLSCEPPARRLPVQQIACLRAYFDCIMKEGMLGGRPGLPEGATLACDEKVKTCSVPR